MEIVAFIEAAQAAVALAQQIKQDCEANASQPTADQLAQLQAAQDAAAAAHAQFQAICAGKVQQQ